MATTLDYDWCLIDPTEEHWHIVLTHNEKTLCGLPVANPDEEWRWTGELQFGQNPCDNCTKALAEFLD